MRRAGILLAHQMPVEGGDGPPTLDLPVRAMAQWKKLRKARAASTSPAKQPSEGNASTTSLLSPDRSWDLEHIRPKRWRWD